jgi:mannose-6-phosphate isomerase-like protein (cupin superfamily)
VATSDWIQETSAYDDWVGSQGVERIVDYYVEDLRTVALRDWPRKGGKGVFINLVGTEDTNDAYLCEIPPGGELKPDRHLYEELVYIVSGRGATKVWQSSDDEPTTFEWQAGSLFAIPLNAGYQHFNASGTEPARYLAVTSAPLIINLFHDPEFVMQCPHEFRGRFAGGADYFSGSGTMHGERVWETNFVADAVNMPLIPRSSRGGDHNIQLELADGTLAAHISEFPVGRYKRAHRHGPGAHVVILKGTGYSLMWPDGEEPRRFDWGPGSVIVPPDMWWHQHFNTGSEPARYLALRWGSKKNHVFKRYTGDISTNAGGNQLDLADQPDQIRLMFEEALRTNGIALNMGFDAS